MKVVMYVHEHFTTSLFGMHLTLYPLCMNKWNKITTLTILAKPVLHCKYLLYSDSTICR